MLLLECQSVVEHHSELHLRRHKDEVVFRNTNVENVTAQILHIALW